jgi:hypothetical protein
MIDELDILAAVSLTEPMSFSDFCGALNNCPERGDREAWRSLFGLLSRCERSGLLVIERDDDRIGSKIESLQLTDAGAAKLRTGKHTRPLRPGESWRG